VVTWLYGVLLCVAVCCRGGQTSQRREVGAAEANEESQIYSHPIDVMSCGMIVFHHILVDRSSLVGDRRTQNHAEFYKTHHDHDSYDTSENRELSQTSEQLGSSEHR